MANINSNFLIVCDTAFTAAETGALNIIGIFDGINAPQFPAIHSRLTVVANIGGDPGKYDAKILIRENKTGFAIAELPSNKKIEIKDGNKAQFIAGFFGLIFKEPGEYLVEFYVEGNKISTTMFFVKKIDEA